MPSGSSACVRRPAWSSPTRAPPTPYHKDPEDSYIRIAPSFPALKDVEQAAKVFCTCLKLATLEKQGN